MKHFFTVLCLILLGACSEQKQEVVKEIAPKLSISKFEDIKEIAFHCFSPYESKYIDFVVKDHKEIKDMMNGFTIETAEECMCKKSSYATFIKEDKSSITVEFGPHSFFSKGIPGLYKTSPIFWELFWAKVKKKKDREPEDREEL